MGNGNLTNPKYFNEHLHVQIPLWAMATNWGADKLRRHYAVQIPLWAMAT